MRLSGVQPVAVRRSARPAVALCLAPCPWDGIIAGVVFGVRPSLGVSRAKAAQDYQFEASEAG